jgi:hypothetical protein
MPGENNSDTGRELIFSRLLDAPLEQVWKVWTPPEHIQHCWGPNGFKNTITKMDVRILKPARPWSIINNRGIDFFINPDICKKICQWKYFINRKI